MLKHNELDCNPRETANMAASILKISSFLDLVFYPREVFLYQINIF